MIRSRRSAALSAGLLAAASVVLSGCAVFSEQTTELDYTPSDGAQADIGGLQVRNLMWIAEASDSPGTLVGFFGNAGSEDVDVSLTSDNGASTEFTVEAGSSYSLGPESDADADEDLTVDAVDRVPGQTIPVTVNGGAESVVINTPVLDGSLPEYADLVPEA